MTNALLEALSAEYKTIKLTSDQRKQLLNFSYNPYKSFPGQFLEEYSTSFDFAVPQSKPINLKC